MLLKNERHKVLARGMARSMALRPGRTPHQEMHDLIDRLFACGMPYATPAENPPGHVRARRARRTLRTLVRSEAMQVRVGWLPLVFLLHPSLGQGVGRERWVRGPSTLPGKVRPTSRSWCEPFDRCGGMPGYFHGCGQGMGFRRTGPGSRRPLRGCLCGAHAHRAWRR